MGKNILRGVLFFAILVSHVHGDDSVFFGNSTDRRLMSNIEKLGELDNGFVVYSWRWNQTARDLDQRYGATEVDGGFISIGFVAQEVAKVYPDAVKTGVSGYLFVDEQELARADQYIRWKLTSDSRTLSGRCSRVRGSRYIMCF